MKQVSLSTLLLLTFLTASSTQAQQALNMTVLGSWDDNTLPMSGSNTFNDCWGYSDCVGGEYAIIGSSAFVHFFDITDPANPVQIDAFEGGNTTTWRDMKTYRDHAYSVCDACQEGLMIYDLSDLPNAVTLVDQTTDFFGPCHNIYIDELHGRMYAVGSSGAFDGVVILDLTQDPGNPQLLANASLPGGYVHDIFVRDNIGYASHGNNGLWVYDFTDPLNPIVLGTLLDYPESGYNHSSWLSDDGATLIMADETHNRSLKSVDVSDLDNIEVIDLFRSTLLAPADTASIVHNPFIRGNYVFMSYYHDGVQVFDMSDPTNVQQVAYYDTEPDNTTYSGFAGCWGVYPFLPSGVIIASDRKNGLFLLRADSLELAPTTPNGALFEPGELQVDAQGNCVGDTLLLSVNAGADSYLWFNNGNEFNTDNSSSVSTTLDGCFSVVALQGACESQSEESCVELDPLPEISLIAQPFANVCEGDTVLLELTTNADAFSWFFNGEVLDTVQGFSFSPPVSGYYEVSGTLNGCQGSSEALLVNFLPAPLPVVNGNSDTLRSSINGLSYQWYLNGVAIPGATNRTWFALEDGAYQVEVTYTNDCSRLSEPYIYELIVGVNSLGVTINSLKAAPNPSDGLVQVSWYSGSVEVLNLFDQHGRLLASYSVEGAQQTFIDIDLSIWPSGMYVLLAQGNDASTVLRLVRP